jgi:DNA-binding transcriptional MerR regulator
MPVEYSLKDVESITGIPANLLRTWERRYGFPKPERKKNNFRYFTDKELLRLLQVYSLNQRGYKLSRLINADEKEILQLLRENLVNSKSNALFPQDLMSVLFDLNEPLFHELFDKLVQKNGFENTMEKVIFPFIRHVGDLWFMNIITPINEHFVSNLIRQKLFSAIDQISLVSTPTNLDSSWIFFLNAHEYHELLLLYCYYLAKKQGKKAFYLGQAVPLEHLSAFIQYMDNPVLVTVFTVPVKNMSFEEYLQNLTSLRKKVTIYYCCNPRIFKANSHSVIRFESPDDFRALLSGHA